MGYYVNAPGLFGVPGAKELYLARRGRQLSSAPRWSEIPDGEVAVCLVNNGPFTAAAIAYSERDLAELARSDGRQSWWFLLSVKDAEAASDWRSGR